MYPSYGYSGYGGYGYGGGYGSYPPYMNGGYGVGAAPISTGPLTSTSITPYENVRGELNHEKHTNDGLLQGGLIGVGAGAVVGGALGACFGGPIGFAIGAVLGGALSGVLGGFLGKKFSGYESTEHDAHDDGKLNGSTLGSDPYSSVSGQPLYY